jgi:hypothetical protein
VGSGVGLELFHRREEGLRKRESSCRHVAVLFAVLAVFWANSLWN